MEPQQTHPPVSHDLVHLHRLQVPCALHGFHVYYVGGLDHAADDAAAHLVRTLKRNGHHVDYDGSLLEVNLLRQILYDEEWANDDLPF